MDSRSTTAVAERVVQIVTQAYPAKFCGQDPAICYPRGINFQNEKAEFSFKLQLYATGYKVFLRLAAVIDDPGSISEKKPTMTIDFYMPPWENKQGEREPEQLIDLECISKEDYDGVVPRPRWSDGNEVPEKGREWTHVFTWKAKGNISYGLDQKFSDKMSARLSEEIVAFRSLATADTLRIFIRGSKVGNYLPTWLHEGEQTSRSWWPYRKNTSGQQIIWGNVTDREKLLQQKQKTTRQNAFLAFAHPAEAEVCLGVGVAREYQCTEMKLKQHEGEYQIRLIKLLDGKFSIGLITSAADPIPAETAFKLAWNVPLDSDAEGEEDNEDEDDEDENAPDSQWAAWVIEAVPGVTKAEETTLIIRHPRQVDADGPNFSLAEQSVWLQLDSNEKSARRQLSAVAGVMAFQRVPWILPALMGRNVRNLLEKQYLENQDLDAIVEKVCGGLPRDAPQPNDSQKAAMRLVLSPPGGVALITGPPGTGKTETIALIVKMLVDNGLKVLVCAPSNFATDNVASKLKQRLSDDAVIRVYPQAVEDRTYDTSGLEKLANVDDVQAALSGPTDTVISPKVAESVLAKFKASIQRRPALPELSLKTTAVRWAQEKADALREQRKAALAPVQEQFLSTLQSLFDNGATPASLVNQLGQFMEEVAIAGGEPKPEADEGQASESHKDHESLIRLGKKRAQRANKLYDHPAIVLSDLLKRKGNWSTEDGQMVRDALGQVYDMVLQEAQIVVTTLNTSATLGRYNHDVCIIDETTQAVEPDCLIPVKGNIKALILVGDEKQLPPTVLSSLEENEFHEQLTVSLFDRLKTCGLKTVILNQQYRMISQLTEHLNRTVYDSKVVNKIRLEDRPLAQLFRSWVQARYSLATNLLWLDVPNGETARDSTMSSFNEANVDCAHATVQELVAQGFNTDDIAIITPYNAQRRLYETRVKVPVHTVDSFQGRESQVIILDLVVAGAEDDNLGFVRNSNRLVVARSRAQAGMVVIGKLSTGSAPRWPASSKPYLDFRKHLMDEGWTAEFTAGRANPSKKRPRSLSGAEEGRRGRKLTSPPWRGRMHIQ